VASRSEEERTGHAAICLTQAVIFPFGGNCRLWEFVVGLKGRGWGGCGFAFFTGGNHQLVEDVFSHLTSLDPNLTYNFITYFR